MSVYKLTCPKCQAVMKSPKPVPAGKKIKCAKCNFVFTTSGDDEDLVEVLESDAGPKKQSAAKTKPDAKSAVKAGKPPKTSKPSPPAAKKPIKDEEEESNTYGFVAEDAPKSEDDDDDDEDDERTKQRKKDLEFALDTSIKDPRGPAQLAVIWPSNILILFGAIPFLLYFTGILWMLWPFFFAERIVSPAQVFNWETSKTPIYTEYKDLTVDQKRAVDDAQWGWALFGIPMRMVIMSICAFGMILSGIVAYGGVKMQMLESWGWAMAAAIIVLLSGGTVSIIVGIWCLLILNDPKVKIGFTYRSEGQA